MTWGRAGLVDLIIPSPFWPSIESDIPIETWKGLLVGTDVEVGMGMESGMDSGSAIRTATHEEMRGVFASGLHQGADLIYLFNIFSSPYQQWPRADHDQLLRDASSYEALRRGPRRHPSTLTRPWAAGEPGADSALPFKGRHGTFRLHLGPLPGDGDRAQVELVATHKGERPAVSVNGIPCPFAGMVDAAHVAASGGSPEERRRVYEVPATALSEGYNLIEIDIEITWLELAVLPIATES